MKRRPLRGTVTSVGGARPDQPAEIRVLIGDGPLGMVGRTVSVELDERFAYWLAATLLAFGEPGAPSPSRPGRRYIARRRSLDDPSWHEDLDR